MVGIFIIMFLFVKLLAQGMPRPWRPARLVLGGRAPGGYHHGSKVARIGA